VVTNLTFTKAEDQVVSVGLWRAHPAYAELFYMYSATRVACSPLVASDSRILSVLNKIHSISVVLRYLDYDSRSHSVDVHVGMTKSTTCHVLQRSVYGNKR
jgi:hypothetical protein